MIHNFLRMMVLGEATADEIDQHIEDWHNSNVVCSLATYLGMTDEEYSRWVKEPAELFKIVQERQFKEPSGQPIPKVGSRIVMECSNPIIKEKYRQPMTGTVLHIFPANEEIPEPLMREYYKPRPGSKYDLKPELLCRAMRHERIVLELDQDKRHIIYPHMVYYWYTEAPK